MSSNNGWIGWKAGGWKAGDGRMEGNGLVWWGSQWKGEAGSVKRLSACMANSNVSSVSQ